MPKKKKKKREKRKKHLQTRLSSPTSSGMCICSREKCNTTRKLLMRIVAQNNQVILNQCLLELQCTWLKCLHNWNMKCFRRLWTPPSSSCRALHVDVNLSGEGASGCVSWETAFTPETSHHLSQHYSNTAQDLVAGGSFQVSSREFSWMRIHQKKTGCMGAESERWR